MLTKDRHFCELFAGKAAVSTAMRAVPCCSNYVCRFVKLLNSNPNRNAGPPKPASSLEADFVGTSMDINLSSAFDMLTAAGMSFLVLVSKLILLVGSSTTRPTACGQYTPMVVAIYDPKSYLTATVKTQKQPNLFWFGLCDPHQACHKRALTLRSWRAGHPGSCVYFIFQDVPRSNYFVVRFSTS